MIDWCQKSATELAAAYARIEVSPVDVLRFALERLDRLNPTLNAVIAQDRGAAMIAAEASARRWQDAAPLSALDGVPFTVKDNIVTAGVATTWGSPLFRDYRSHIDELPVARMRDAGAVMIGKTNLPELAAQGYTDNALFGPTGNPWNPALTPGGSSGGAAAGVAAGFVPAAVGTDGGGSIRRPASHTGLVGFKPSIGRIARGLGFPETLHDFEVIGTLARSVADTILLDGVLAGPDPRDRRSMVAATPLRPGPNLRVLYVPRFGDAPIDPEVLAATDALARQLGNLGHAVETGPVFFDRAVVDEIWRVVGRSGVASVFRSDSGRGLASEGGPSIQAMAADGLAITAADYVDALARLTAFRRDLAALFERVDLVLMPSAAALPWPAAEAFPPRIADVEVGPRGHAIYTGWVNVAGNPAVALPVAFSDAGLPIGVQIVGPFGSDDALLAFAARLDASWSRPQRWPSLAA